MAKPYTSDPVFTGPAEVRIQGQAPTRLSDSSFGDSHFQFPIRGQDIVPVRAFRQNRERGVEESVSVRLQAAQLLVPSVFQLDRS